MTEKQTIRWLKIIIVIGLCLLLIGHYLLTYSDLPERLGVTGIVISASLIALGLIFSLPTKMYLTFILVKRESEKDKKPSNRG